MPCTAGASGRTLVEATHINKSLHFLSVCIRALHDRAKLQERFGRQGMERGRAMMRAAQQVHVPYRNSVLTSLLRDSLGGNSLTRVIATVSAAGSNTGESVSTCRFAQMIARIRNAPAVNVETDPAVLVQQLRR